MSDQRALVLDAVRQYHQQQAQEKPFVPGVTEIWPSGAVLEEEDRVALVTAALDMRIAAGPSSRKFESQFARRLKLGDEIPQGPVGHAISHSQALGLGPGRAGVTCGRSVKSRP